MVSDIRYGNEIARMNERIVNLRAKNERLRAALRAIADDDDTNIEAAVYAKNVLADLEK